MLGVLAFPKVRAELCTDQRAGESVLRWRWNLRTLAVERFREINGG